MLNSLAAIYTGAGTPASTTAYESIATVTVGASSVATISFSSIPNTYKSLEIRYIARTDRGANSDVILVNPNSSATTTGHYLYGNGSSALGGVLNGFFGWATSASSGSNYFGAGIATIIDYADTNKNKVVRTLAGYDLNTSGELALTSNLQTSTTAMSSLTVTSSNGANFTQYSQFALYGVK